MIRFLDFFTSYNAIKHDRTGIPIVSDTEEITDSVPIIFITQNPEGGNNPYEALDLDTHPDAKLLKYCEMGWISLQMIDGKPSIWIYLIYDDVINIRTLPAEQYSDIPTPFTVGELYGILDDDTPCYMNGVFTSRMMVTTISVESKRPISKSKCDPYFMITPSESIIQIQNPNTNATGIAYEGTE